MSWFHFHSWNPWKGVWEDDANVHGADGKVKRMYRIIRQERTCITCGFKEQNIDRQELGSVNNW